MGDSIEAIAWTPDIRFCIDFMDFLHLTPQQWMLAGTAALMVGLAKSGFNGVGMLVLVLMANVMRGHERESTGVVLPLLICGDLLAWHAFRLHVRWNLLWRMLLPAGIGIGIGYFFLRGLTNHGFKPLIGIIVLLLTGLHLLRQASPGKFQNIPRGPWFAWAMGILAGITTMMANAAGPIVTLLFLSLALPKMELVGTGALFFLLVNLFKVPFSLHLGFITAPSLGFNAALVPFVALGIAGGRFLLHRIDQLLFEKLLILLTLLTALHLVFF